MSPFFRKERGFLLVSSMWKWEETRFSHPATYGTLTIVCLFHEKMKSTEIGE